MPSILFTGRALSQNSEREYGNCIEHRGRSAGVFGGVWFLQGVNVLPGIFMSGQIRWCVEVRRSVMMRKPQVPIGNSGSHHPWRCTVQKRIAVVFVALAALLAAGSTAQAQSPDPWFGTWKVNLAKSTYSPGPKPTVAATVKMEPSA